MSKQSCSNVWVNMYRQHEDRICVVLGCIRYTSTHALLHIGIYTREEGRVTALLIPTNVKKYTPPSLSLIYARTRMCSHVQSLILLSFVVLLLFSVCITSDDVRNNMVCIRRCIKMRQGVPYRTLPSQQPPSVVCVVLLKTKYILWCTVSKVPWN